VNIPQYVALVAEGHADAAVDTIRRRNPFVSVCGRVCDHPCESRCRRADLDEPLAIRALKRFAADHARKGSALLAPPATGQPVVAIVGAGPAGLSCAYFLALMGRPSVVFEAESIPGGMLALGIPEYRLPKSILAADIDYILRHGVELRTSTPVKNIADLKSQGFRAVFLATGAQKGRPLGVEGDTVEGVLDSLAILRARGLGKTPHLGKQVVVVGGGNAAVDAARSAVRLGAEKVTILYRRTREEMPAYEEEIEEALKEKVVLHELAAPKRVLSQDGKCTGIEAIRMRLGDADDGGRRRPEPVAGSEFVIACDTVLAAIGQAPSTEAAATVAPAPGKVVPVDMATLATSVPGIYAGGDVTSGGGTVIEAIANGQRAACSIDRYLGGKGQLPPDVTFSLRRPTEEEAMASTERPREPMLAAAKRKGTFDEVVRGLTPAKACKEAGRCLRCDLEKLLD
jgi:NADPH-dependent glutamate synthase beta subunit-like oxidoreductase